ncbi:hypothetical protein [Brevundimonas sp. Root1423]|nr:hypothetical protein [Brevundimonas sp. Root1423]
MTECLAIEGGPARRALHPDLIQTVQGKGYALAADCLWAPA